MVHDHIKEYKQMLPSSQYVTCPCRHVLSDPELEGSPLEFLKQTEAYWKVSVAQPGSHTWDGHLLQLSGRGVAEVI